MDFGLRLVGDSKVSKRLIASMQALSGGAGTGCSPLSGTIVADAARSGSLSGTVLEGVGARDGKGRGSEALGTVCRSFGRREGMAGEWVWDSWRGDRAAATGIKDGRRTVGKLERMFDVSFPRAAEQQRLWRFCTACQTAPPRSPMAPAYRRVQSFYARLMQSAELGG